MLSQMPPEANIALPGQRIDGSQAPMQQYAVQQYDAFPSTNQMSPLRSPTKSRLHPYSPRPNEGAIVEKTQTLVIAEIQIQGR